MILRRLDPRTKLVIMLALSSASIFNNHLPSLAAVAALTLIILALDVRTFLTGLRSVRSLAGLIALLFVVQCVFTRQGEPALVVRGVVLVYSGGIKTGAAVALRLAVIMLSALIVKTGQTRDYLLALTQSGVPYELAFMVMVALRFIPLLREEAANVLNAVQMRGTKLKKTGPARRLRVYASVLLPIAAGAVRRSEHISTAMEARAFRSRPHRTSMRRLRFTAADAIFAPLFAAALLVIVIL